MQTNPANNICPMMSYDFSYDFSYEWPLWPNYLLRLQLLLSTKLLLVGLGSCVMLIGRGPSNFLFCTLREVFSDILRLLVEDLPDYWPTIFQFSCFRKQWISDIFSELFMYFEELFNMFFSRNSLDWLCLPRSGLHVF